MPHKKAAPKQVPKQVNNQLNESSESGDHNESAAGDGQFNMNSQLAGLTSAMMNNPAALQMMQAKLGGMVGTLSGYYDTLPKVVKRRVKALKKLQVDSLKLEAKLSEEIHELECKYQQLYEPLNKKRTEIVTGLYEPNDDECDFPSDAEEDADPDAPKDATSGGTEPTNDLNKSDAADAKEPAAHGLDESAKGIPEFWLTILKNVETFAENIQEYDEPILAHLTDVSVKMIPKPMGFTLEFHFEPNDYFTNETLTKHYDMRAVVDEDDPFSFDGAEIVKCKGCDISWKKGKNVTIRTVNKKQKHKTKGNTRTVTKTVPNDSFFNFFSPPAVPDDLDELDEETQALLSMDFEMGEIIRQRLTTRAVLYFTGEAVADDDYDDDDEEEDDEDDEDPTGDGEDDDEDDDEDFEPPKNTPGKKGAKGKSGQNPEECKQQ